jgi:hypothetical protein
VQARVAKDKAYKDFLENQLGTSIPGLAQYMSTKRKTFAQRKEDRLKK